MRKIKFRAWFENEREMRSVSMSNVYEVNNKYLYLSPLPMSDYKEIELMQYTGIQDRNGAEIYEGDLVTHVEDDETWGASLIVFEDGIFCFKDDYPNYLSLHESLEVIGNIYENPNLINDFKD